MKKLFAWTLIVLSLLLFVGCGREKLPSHDDNPLSSGSGWHGDLPKGIRPMVMVNGKLYRWTGMSKEFLFQGAEVYRIGDSSTVLPEGYTAFGEISGITEEVPSEELQLRAGFEATGTVYVSDRTPEAVYIFMTTDWFSDSYIRFVSDDLHDNECIAYLGQQYLFRLDGEIVKELPETCTLIGTLNYIGADSIPLQDLETNRIADGYSKFLDGREVYANPNDSAVLYVYEHHYWAQGDYPAWRVCPLWTE